MIKKYNSKYFNDCANMLGKVWDLGSKSSQTPKSLCQKIYMYELLFYGDLLYVYVVNNKAVGMVGLTITNKKRKGIKYRFYKYRKNKLMKDKIIKNKDALIKYYECYDYASEEIKNQCDCELDILILDEEYRGKKLGLKLFNFICEKASAKGLKNLRIDTDESCSFDFYEKCGCVKLQEQNTNAYGEGEGEKVFVYSKRLY